VLNREVNRALQLPDVRERLTALGTEIAGGTPEALSAAIASEVQKWSKLVKDRNLKFD
jgi:tripartite-type tricarboxylate transporter receptor subunit TctC